MLRCALLLLLAVPAAGAAPVDQGALLAREPREYAIEPYGAHTFTVALEPGRTCHVRVEQLETYLDLRWSAGASPRRINDRRGRTGREEVFFVPDAAGAGTIQVGNLTSQAGRYRIELTTRDATDADRERHTVEQEAQAPAAAAQRAAAARFGALGLVDRQLRTLDRSVYRGVAEGDVPAAVAAAEECVALARPAGKDDALSSCLLGLAHALDTSGALDRASGHYAEAVAIRERLGDPLLVAMALADSANLPMVRGDYEEAERVYRRSLALARETGDEHTEAVNLMNLATLDAHRGHVEEMVAAAERIRDLGRRRGRAEMEAVGALNAGIAYGNLGEAGRAIARIRDASAIADAGGLQRLAANARIALGAAHEDARDLEGARRELEAGVAAARAVDDPVLVAAGETWLGWILARLGHVDDGLRHIAEGAAAARRAGGRLEEATAWMYEGKALLLAGRPAEAGVVLERALGVFRDSGRVNDEGTTILAQTQVLQAQGDLAGAADRADQAIALFESMRARVALADQRARYAGYRREAYDLGVSLAIARARDEPGRGHLARAFDLTERVRARSLVEELLARRGVRADAPADLAAAHRRALDRLGHLQRELVVLHTTGTPDPARRAGLERDLREAVDAEETARRSIRQHEGRTDAADAPPTAADHARRLADDEAILVYHVAEARSWLFLVSREGLAVEEMPGAPVLRRRVDELRALLSTPRTLGAGAYAAAAGSAFETLLAPVLSGRPRLRRLRLVPDGPLWEVPFEALVTGPAPGGGFARLPYVLSRYTVSYHPSAAGRPAPAPAAPAATGALELVAFADPLVPAEGPTGDGATRVERAVFREGERWSLPRLACAEREARQAAALFGSAAARVHLGAGARESVVKSDRDVARARYLLFATHALLSETMPSQSALVLSLSGDGREDGLLQVHEVDALALAAELVVLSACETALGENVRGEGLLGLARAFFHAGARRLVVSQWKVADCGAADVGVELFRHLRGGGAEDVAAALRAAKRRVASRAALAHPYYWAPFVLVE